MKRARRFLAAALVTSAAVTTAACARIFGFEHLTERDVVDAGSDAEPSTPAAVACVGAVPPTRGDGGSGATVLMPPNEPHYVALKSLHYDNDAVKPGFNLDGTCTTSRETNACAVRAGEDFSDFGIDGDGGIDNAFASIPHRVGSQFNDPDASPEFSADTLSERIHDGRFGAVFSLFDWNGTDEDSEVHVAFYPALGLWMRRGADYVRNAEISDGGAFFTFDALTDAGAFSDPAVISAGQRSDPVDGGIFVPGGLWDGGLLLPGGPPKPVLGTNWEPTDLWMRDARFPLPFTPYEAYVTHGQLVAKFESLTFPIRVNWDRRMFDIELDSVSLVATIAVESGRVVLKDGVFAGMWQASKLLDQIRTMFVKLGGPVGDGFVCDLPVYNDFQNFICRRAESLVRAQADGGRPACDSLSVGVGFDTYAIDDLAPYYSDRRQFHADAGADAAPDAQPSPDVLRVEDRCRGPADAACPP